jgi:hypothetical protein
MVLSMTWLEFKDMAQDPLVRREQVSASCNRLPDKGLETQKYSIYPNEHPANKGNNKITELRTILQRESPNS